MNNTRDARGRVGTPLSPMWSAARRAQPHAASTQHPQGHVNSATRLVCGSAVEKQGRLCRKCLLADSRRPPATTASRATTSHYKRSHAQSASMNGPRGAPPTSRPPCGQGAFSALVPENVAWNASREESSRVATADAAQPPACGIACAASERAASASGITAVALTSKVFGWYVRKGRASREATFPMQCG